MAKISLELQGKLENTFDRGKHDGGPGGTFENDDTQAKAPRAKKKSLLRNQNQVQDQGAYKYPHDYIDKMFVSKSNWLGRLERGRER